MTLAVRRAGRLGRARHATRSAALVVAGLGLAALLLGSCTPPSSAPRAPIYPIVLAHGALGMESYGPLDYWFGIVDALEEQGATVFVTEVSPVHSSLVRGEQLLAQLQDILATTGAAKLHLIGHSQGGLDVRYAAGVLGPSRVASVTTIAGPHKGTELAGFLASGILDDGTFTSALVDLFGGVLEDFLAFVTGMDQALDARAALHGLAPSVQAGFTALFPNGVPSGCGEGAAVVNGVHYFSWMGSTPVTNALDPIDAFWALSSTVFLFLANDGIVSVCSAQFGDVIRNDYMMNHTDEVNQIAGLVSPLETNPVTLFRNHATRLANLGL